VVAHVVRPTHTTFIQERNILDGIVILHETNQTIYERHQKNNDVINTKDRLQKAYNKVK
jgi:hypothetical protein